MTVVEPREGLRLPVPDEPVDMGARLRSAVLEGANWRDGFEEDMCVGVWLWDQWSRALEPAGMDREAFLDVIVGYRRELWFWLVGERGWDPFVTGLAGRVARRMPAG